MTLIKSLPWISITHNLDYVLKGDECLQYKISKKFCEAVGLYHTIKKSELNLTQTWVNILNHMKAKDWVRFWVERWGKNSIENYFKNFPGITIPEFCTGEQKLYDDKGKIQYNMAAKWSEKYSLGMNMYTENFTVLLKC